MAARGDTRRCPHISRLQRASRMTFATTEVRGVLAPDHKVRVGRVGGDSQALHLRAHPGVDERRHAVVVDRAGRKHPVLVRPTWARVQAAAAREYTPNNLPRNLRTRSSRVIALLISDVTNPFFGALIRGAEAAAERHGYSLVLANTDEDETREAAAMNTFAAERVGGAVIACTSSDSGALRKFVSTGIPIVGVDRRIDGVAIDTVTLDNDTAACEAVKRLIWRGHRASR